MVVVKLEHSNLAQHQATVFKHLQMFRKEGQLCDVVVKSNDGVEHGAHTTVLCAASMDLKNMLVGPFAEANQVQRGQPVEMAASDSVVLALLEYIYGEEPRIDLEDSLELLRLTEAYHFSELAAAIEGGLSAVLDSAPVATALKFLRQTQGMHKLNAKCEEKVAANFEMCIHHVDFLELSPTQLDRILRREDLNVSCEEVVMRALWKWFKWSNDRGSCFGVLLHNVEFQSLASSSLAQLQNKSESMGQIGHDLQREIGEALQAHKKRSSAVTPEAFRPKRRCFQHWSPDLGASVKAPQKVVPYAISMCCHDGAIYFAADHSVFRWKPGDPESQAVAGRGARVNGSNDLGDFCQVSVSPGGTLFVADVHSRRLLSFADGFGNVVLSEVDIHSVFCSPSGAVYVLTQRGEAVDAVEKLVGSTLQPLMPSEHLPAELQFGASELFVTKDEVIYLSAWANDCIFRIKPDEAEPVTVGEAPNSELRGLFVTEDDKVYIADSEQGKVWAFHPGDATWTEVLTCPGELKPFDVLVQGKSLYVSMGGAGDLNGVYQYLLPPELQLE